MLKILKKLKGLTFWTSNSQEHNGTYDRVAEKNTSMRVKLNIPKYDKIGFYDELEPSMSNEDKRIRWSLQKKGICPDTHYAVRVNVTDEMVKHLSIEREDFQKAFKALDRYRRNVTRRVKNFTMKKIIAEAIDWAYCDFHSSSSSFGLSGYRNHVEREDIQGTMIFFIRFEHRGVPIEPHTIKRFLVDMIEDECRRVILSCKGISEHKEYQFVSGGRILRSYNGVFDNFFPKGVLKFI